MSPIVVVESEVYEVDVRVLRTNLCREVPQGHFSRFTLNRNPESYFAEIGQAAFSPSHMVCGVKPSADPVLQSCLFPYSNTHRHRLGGSYEQISVNCLLRSLSPWHRDSAMNMHGNYGANPAYLSTFRPLAYKPVKPVKPIKPIKQSQEHEK